MVCFSSTETLPVVFAQPIRKNRLRRVNQPNLIAPPLMDSPSQADHAGEKRWPVTTLLRARGWDKQRMIGYRFRQSEFNPFPSRMRLLRIPDIEFIAL